MSTPQQEALDKALEKSIRRAKDKGRYISPKGVRYRSKAEQRKMLKSFPSSKVSRETKDPRFKAGTFGSDTTEEEKREYQRKHRRAWNE